VAPSGPILLGETRLVIRHILQLLGEFEAKRAKSKASRERKIARREERLAQVR